MNTNKKLATLSLIALACFGTLKAQTSNDNLLAFNTVSNPKTEVIKAETNLTAPVVKSGTSSYDAREASFNENLAVIIHHGKNDPISGERYAKGFANGFASAEKTNNLPIYITAVHNDDAYEGPTYVEVFMNGQLWDYKDVAQLSPSDAGRLAPVIMDEYVKKYGRTKILPAKVKPVKVASLN